MVYCGDCGEKTRMEGFYRICDTCGSRTRVRKVTGRARSEPNLQNIPIRTAEGRRIRNAFPKPELNFDYAELERRFTGGGIQGACHTCGNAHNECEC